MRNRLLKSVHLSAYAFWAYVALASSSLAQGQEAGFEIISDSPVNYDLKTNEMVLTDGASVSYSSADLGETLLTADNIRINQSTSEAHAEGNVILTRGEIRLIADSIDFQPKNDFASIKNFRAGNGRLFVAGSQIEGSPNDFRFSDIELIPGEPGTFLFKARAGEIALIDQKQVEGSKIRFNLGILPFLILPNISQPIDAETNNFKPEVDYSGHIGLGLGGEFLIPTGDGWRLGANLLATTKRGILAGPSARYNLGEEDSFARGSLSTGYIDDKSSEVGLDVNGAPIDDERYFVEWDHNQHWGDAFSLNALVRYWSDSEVTRDFREDSFNAMQNPDSYLEANYRSNDWQLSVFTRASPNEFDDFVERLPELKLQLFPSKIADGLYHHGFVSAAKLELENSISGIDEDSERIDSYYGFNWQRHSKSGITFGAKLGARATHYFDTNTIVGYDPLNTIQPLYSATEGTRAYGDLGLDLKFTAYSQTDYKNDTWNIDGLRHIIEPAFSYRYIPELDGDDNSISFIDNSVFANYLTPIDLEDRRDIDTLNEEHLVRFELRNRIQTKDEAYGSRDLARFSFAIDHYIDDTYTADDWSKLHFDAELTPAPWLEVGLFTRYDFDESQFSEINTHISITDTGYWKVGFGSQFLRKEIEQYLLFGEYSFNENWKLYAVARYDEKSGVFYEQRIGLLQRALENYGLKYEIRIYDGDRRESDIGIRLGIDLFDEFGRRK